MMLADTPELPLAGLALPLTSWWYIQVNNSLVDVNSQDKVRFWGQRLWLPLVTGDEGKR